MSGEATLAEVVDGVADAVGIGWMSRSDALGIIVDFAGISEDAAGALLDAPPVTGHAQWHYAAKVIKGGIPPGVQDRKAGDR